MEDTRCEIAVACHESVAAAVDQVRCPRDMPGHPQRSIATTAPSSSNFLATLATLWANRLSSANHLYWCSKPICHQPSVHFIRSRHTQSTPSFSHENRQGRAPMHPLRKLRVADHPLQHDHLPRWRWLAPGCRIFTRRVGRDH